MSLSSLSKYSDLKVFNYPDFISNLPTGTNAPLHVRIKLTNHCNHNCNYCAFRIKSNPLSHNVNKLDFIPTKKMFEIIHDLRDMGTKAITFSGAGEPCLYPKFAEVIRRLSPIKFAMLTNGALFKGEIADLFAQYGSWVRVSIDGWDRESYKKFRGVDDFDKVIENLMNFKSEKCKLGVNIVVTRENAHHIYGLYQTLSQANLDSIKISPCLPSDSVAKNIEYHKPIFKIVAHQISKIPTKRLSNTYREQLTSFVKDYNWCPNIQIQPVIAADQNIYSCHDLAFRKEGLLGSFKDCSFREAWEKADKFKIDPRNCKNHCMAHHKNELILSYMDLYKEHIEFA